MRTVLASTLAIFVSLAPVQCSHNSSDPNLRAEDSPGDALWALAQDFRAKGNDDAARQTLRYLVDHYPSNRHTPAARAELGDSAPAGDAGK